MIQPHFKLKSIIAMLLICISLEAYRKEAYKFFDKFYVLEVVSHHILLCATVEAI